MVVTWQCNDDPQLPGWRCGCLEPDCDMNPFTKTRWGTEREAIESWNTRHESDELKRLRDELQTANTEIDMLRDTLSLIEQSGGRYSHDELGMSYNGSWCAEQARRVLEETK